MEKKKVLIIATGGTIAMKSETDWLSGEELVSKFPKLRDVVEIEIFQFTNKGSSCITPTLWVNLAHLINKEANNFTGLVVLHGTDTLEETAFFLNLTVKTTKPVVVVGAMRNSIELSSDVEANLFNSLRLAISALAENKGVLVLLNDEIHSGRDVMKYDNVKVNTMRSPYGYLGVTDRDKIIFYRRSEKPHTVTTEFDLSKRNSSIPVVPIIADYSGFDHEIFASVQNQALGGVIIQSFAGGRLSPGMHHFVLGLLKNNTIVIIASRIPEGRIFSLSELEKIIYAADLTPQKARILLMLCLFENKSISEIVTAFQYY